MKLSEFAHREGISVQRAGKLAREQRIPATLVNGSWVVADGASVDRRLRRPLAEQSRHDLLWFLDQKTFDGITGTRKRRAAERVRMFLAADDPAKLLRDWWGDDVPPGRGGAAVIRAAQLGYDQQVHDAQQRMGVWILDSPQQLAGRVSDWRAIRGHSIEELSEITNIPPRYLAKIEKTGFSPRGNRDAARVVKALRVPAVRVESERGTE